MNITHVCNLFSSYGASNEIHTYLIILYTFGKLWGFEILVKNLA